MVSLWVSNSTQCRKLQTQVILCTKGNLFILYSFGHFRLQGKQLGATSIGHLESLTTCMCWKTHRHLSVSANCYRSKLFSIVTTHSIPSLGACMLSCVHFHTKWHMMSHDITVLLWDWHHVHYVHNKLLQDMESCAKPKHSSQTCRNRDLTTITMATGCKNT